MSIFYHDAHILKEVHPKILINKTMYETVKENAPFKNLKINILDGNFDKKNNVYPVLYSFQNKFIVFHMTNFDYMDNLLKFSYHILIFVS